MNTHTDAEIPKGREKEKRNERKKHIINLKNHEYKMPRSKKESKYQNIKTHRLQIPSWKNIQEKKKRIKTRKRVTDVKSHKNIKQSETRKGEGKNSKIQGLHHRTKKSQT